MTREHEIKVRSGFLCCKAWRQVGHCGMSFLHCHDVVDEMRGWIMLRCGVCGAGNAGPDVRVVVCNKMCVLLLLLLWIVVVLHRET